MFVASPVGVPQPSRYLVLWPATEARQQHSHSKFCIFIYPSINFEHHTQFFTSTIYEWKHLILSNVSDRDVLIPSNVSARDVALL
jgi:hypothetical protein